MAPMVLFGADLGVALIKATIVAPAATIVGRISAAATMVFVFSGLLRHSFLIQLFIG